MSHIISSKKKKLVIIFIICSLIIVGMLSGCVEETDQRIIFESLRDAPLSPDNPDYQDFLENMHKYQEL
jgi:hypothetical protein